MRMQVILDSSFARPGSASIWGGKKGEFRDWTNATSNHKKSKHSFFEHSDTKPKSIAFHLRYLLLFCVAPFTFFIVKKQKNTRDFKQSLDQNYMLYVSRHKRATFKHTTEQWEVEHSIVVTFNVLCHVYQHGQVTDKSKLFMLMVELSHSNLCNGMLTATWRFRLNSEISTDLIFRKY